MRKRYIILATTLAAALIAATIAVVVQPFVTPLSFTPPKVDSARLQAHVKRLSVDFYPRSFEQSGNIERAAGYILDEFKASGAVVTVQEVTVLGKTYKTSSAALAQKLAPCS